ncbi:hypothetical protein OsI_35930 [Oryza sativa Indica Group]|uniref:Uncharacterized protein n=1 Tax=Oryza sativa subsp. indica TaxID=39946 RepID=B8BK85_ORYSI|nr:hypothetical protein OsI_35930 [Oryza sativa Indica Group]
MVSRSHLNQIHGSSNSSIPFHLASPISLPSSRPQVAGAQTCGERAATRREEEVASAQTCGERAATQREEEKVARRKFCGEARCEVGGGAAREEGGEARARRRKRRRGREEEEKDRERGGACEDWEVGRIVWCGKEG